MFDSLIIAAETSAVETILKLFEICSVIGSADAVEKVALLAKKVSDTRKSLEKYEPDMMGVTKITSEQRAALNQIVPTPAVAQLFRVVIQVTSEIEKRLAGLVNLLRRATTMEEAVPLAKEISDIRKALMKEKSFRQTIQFSAGELESAVHSPASPSSPSSTTTPSFQGTPKSGEGRKLSHNGLRRQTLNIILSPEKLPELKGMASSSIGDLRSRLELLSAAFTQSQDMDEAVKYARILSQSRKELEKVKDTGFEFPSAALDHIQVPANSTPSMRDLFRAANQVMRETIYLVDHIKKKVDDSGSVEDLMRLVKSVRDAHQILEPVQNVTPVQLPRPVSTPATPKDEKRTSWSLNPNEVEKAVPRPTRFDQKRLSISRSSLQASIRFPDSQILQKAFVAEQRVVSSQELKLESSKAAKTLSSSIPANIAANYLKELRKTSNLVIEDIHKNLSLLQRRVSEVKEVSSAIAILRLLDELKKPLYKFPGKGNLQQLRVKFMAIQDGFYRVVVVVLDDIINRFKLLRAALDAVNMVEEALPLAKNLNDIRSILGNYFRKVTPSHGAQQPRSARTSLSYQDAGAFSKPIAVASSRGGPATVETASPQVKDMSIVSLETIISEMKKCCEDGGLQKEVEVNLTMDKKLIKLQQLVRKDLEESKTAADLEKQVSTIQKEIVSLDAHRHKLSLAVHNVERKIQLAVKAQKMDEEDEIFQFFDESTQTDHPLGNLKERYENILYLLRQTPDYITEMMPFIPHEALDSITQTITGALFSDMFFYREEAMLLKLIKQVMAKAFEDCTDVNNFLRRNSLLTKLMAGYTKRQSGKLHLYEILRREMELLFEGDVHNLELDPGKILAEVAESKGRSEFQATPEDQQQAKEIVAQNSSKLQQFCATFLKSIISKRESMPFGIRWLSKELLRVAHTKFPEMSEKDNIILVGSFVFLRYIVPAIMTPEVYGINGTKVITPRQRRNLILCSKVLQNLANDVEFGEKESFMVAMNPFINQSKGFLFEYLKFVVDVVEPEEYYHLLSGSSAAVGMLAHPITVTPNELFLIHRILLQNHAEIIKDTGDPLTKLLFEMGPPREPLPKSKNKYMVLDVLNLDRSDWIANQSGNMVKILKDKLFTILKTSRPIPSHPNPDAGLCDILETIKKPSDTTLFAEIDFIQKKLNTVPAEQRPIVEQDILNEVEKEMDGRKVYRDNLQREKEELTIALGRQQKLVEEKNSEKKIYTEYFSNIQKRSFILKVGNSPDKRIGPFTFPLKDLEKLKLVEKNPKLEQIRSGFSVEFSSSAPGSILMINKTKDDSRTFHIEISQLIDDMVVRDVVEFGGITYDLRRLVSFLHSKFIG